MPAHIPTERKKKTFSFSNKSQEKDIVKGKLFKGGKLFASKGRLNRNFELVDLGDKRRKKELIDISNK